MATPTDANNDNIDPDGDPDIPDLDDLESVASDMTEVRDFHPYYIQRNNRLFHSHSMIAASVYPLPVDGGEQNRHDALHNCLRILIREHYFGPLHQALVPGRRKKVVDFGTGTGKWPLALAADMRDVKFYGLDAVPIATRYPPINVQFEIHDINTVTRFDDGEIDVVHARDIALCLRASFRPFVDESARILRPGGLLFSGEWDFTPRIFGFGPNIPAYGILHFQQILYLALQLVNGPYPNPRAVPFDLQASGQFMQVVTRDFYLPIGAWPADEMMQRVGKVMRYSYIKYAEAMRTVLQDSGISDSDIDGMIEDLKDDLFNIPNLYVVYHAVWARRA